MGNAETKEAVEGGNASIVLPAVSTPASGEKKKCKACCACPETKKIRDQCIMENGEEKCGPQIEAHKQCMKYMGFNV